MCAYEVMIRVLMLMMEMVGSKCFAEKDPFDQKCGVFSGERLERVVFVLVGWWFLWRLVVVCACLFPFYPNPLRYILNITRDAEYITDMYVPRTFISAWCNQHSKGWCWMVPLQFSCLFGGSFGNFVWLLFGL